MIALVLQQQHKDERNTSDEHSSSGVMLVFRVQIFCRFVIRSVSGYLELIRAHVSDTLNWSHPHARLAFLWVWSGRKLIVLNATERYKVCTLSSYIFVKLSTNLSTQQRFYNAYVSDTRTVSDYLTGYPSHSVSHAILPIEWSEIVLSFRFFQRKPVFIVLASIGGFILVGIIFLSQLPVFLNYQSRRSKRWKAAIKARALDLTTLVDGASSRRRHTNEFEEHVRDMERYENFSPKIRF